jgi:hypothetical protein
MSCMDRMYTTIKRSGVLEFRMDFTFGRGVRAVRIKGMLEERWLAAQWIIRGCCHEMMSDAECFAVFLPIMVS